jgi:hypothetical protein
MLICMDTLGYVGYLWIYMYMGLQWNISDLLYWIRYPSWISIHIHAYPYISIKDLHGYPLYTQKSYLCAIHDVIHQGIHSYPFSTLHIHVYPSEISILDIDKYPCSISMSLSLAHPLRYLLYPYISINIQNQYT